MEMGLTQADAARRLKVYQTLVQRLGDQFEPKNTISKRTVLRRSCVTTPAADHLPAFLIRRMRTPPYLSSFQILLPQQRQEYRLLMRKLFIIKYCMQEEHLRVSHLIQDRELAVCIRKYSTLLGTDSNGNRYSSQMNPDLL
ncbi:hypothetical protein AVEN_69931-1 [Araneus ventricosus]|uniref:Uncharacterized protein n=1 Tax=Araneus ventricosus TaxID=182803 RepID=A0A4Y2WSG6_ARAVE|nr:hypothetical protein AVEN_69931-1 [Araneus ventricosus]